MNNIERRNAGIAYISDDAVMAEQKICRRILHRLNTMDPSDFEGLSAVVRELLGSGENAFINPPFHCDYGTRIHAGKNLFINYNCTIIDTGEVTIGDNCQLAPNVSLFTAGHPLHPVSRNSLYEFGKPITIGDNVWLGGGTIVLPGVTIGSNSVIGAGSVVTRDIPEWSLAVGNPCRVIRRITELDKPYFYRQERFDEQAWADILAYEAKLQAEREQAPLGEAEQSPENEAAPFSAQEETRRLTVEADQPPAVPMKIAVLGHSGSGKSTLAQALARKYSLPLLHMDRVFWLPGWKERPPEQCQAIVEAFLDTHDSWVIDGNYHKPCYLYARRMAEADRILFLDLDRVACFARALKRAAEYRGCERDSMGEGCTEKFDLEFARWILHDGRDAQHTAVQHALKTKYADKITVFRNQRALDAFYTEEGLERSAANV